MKVNTSSYTRAIWVVILVFAITNTIAGLSDSKLIQELNPFIAVLAFMVFSVMHGIKNMGGRNMLVFFMLTTIISWSYETLSILTGFPFGNYYYTELLGPKLWLVPLLIMPAYFGVLYLSWLIAHVLLDKISLRFSKEKVFVVPLIASFVMVIWDLCMDPFMATISKNWIWEDGGAYWGVPFVNYMGWFLCVYTIFQMFAIYLLKKDKGQPENDELHTKANWLQPVLFYGAVSIKHLLDPINAESEAILSADGKTWLTDDIYSALSLVTIFTMVFLVILSVIKLNTHFRKQE